MEYNVCNVKIKRMNIMYDKEYRVSRNSLRMSTYEYVWMSTQNCMDLFLWSRQTYFTK